MLVAFDLCSKQQKQATGNPLLELKEAPTTVTL